jgi:hypothetical protein
MGTTTSRVGLYKPLTDGSEFVNVATDLDANYDLLDGAVGFQSCTSSTRPGTPYSGKPIMQTDTTYSTYFSNGTSPASASWVEIPNSSSTFAATLKLGAALTITGASATITRASATNPAINLQITGDTNARLLQQADGKLVWGSGSTTGDTNLYRSAADTLKTDDNLIVGGNLTIGSATYRNLLSTGPTTVANTITETVIATGTIAAGDAVAGAVYRMVAYGVASTTGTPNFSITARLGGVAGTSMGVVGATATASAISGRPWKAEYFLRCVSAGASAVWSPFLGVQHSLASGAQVGAVQHPNSIPNQTVDSTVSEAMVLTWIWGTANASNTMTCTGVVFERVA